MRRVALCLICMAPLACAPLPEIQGSEAAQRAPFPALLPFSAVYGAPTGPATAAVDLLVGTETRAANLRARAAALRSSNDIEAIRARLTR